MADELQALIERIQTEAVAKGEQQAAQLVAQARARAAELVREAEERARQIVEKAELDARQFTERSLQTLSQASRDLLITVGQGVENIISTLAVETVDEALTVETVRDMLVKMAEAYVRRSGRDRRIEILLSPEDQARLVEFFKDRYFDKVQKGLELRADGNIVKGFHVSFVDERVRHDFTREAIAEALAQFLRPHLADIVRRVARAPVHPGDERS